MFSGWTPDYHIWPDRSEFEDAAEANGVAVEEKLAYEDGLPIDFVNLKEEYKEGFRQEALALARGEAE